MQKLQYLNFNQSKSAAAANKDEIQNQMLFYGYPSDINDEQVKNVKEKSQAYGAQLSDDQTKTILELRNQIELCRKKESANQHHSDQSNKQ